MTSKDAIQVSAKNFKLFKEYSAGYINYQSLKLYIEKVSNEYEEVV
jgi:hypothetical protein